MKSNYHKTDYESLTIVDLFMANSSILIVRKNNVDFYLKIHLKNKSKTLIAFSNGAQDPKKRKPPFFSRSSWHNEIKSNCIFIDDPTLHNNNLRVGWGLGDEHHYYLDSISEIIKKIASILEIPSSETFYFGSSAGGFMSLVLSAKDKNSSCVINNPQFSIYEERLIDFVKGFSPEKTNDEILNEYSERYSFFNVIKQTEYFPDITYILNRYSHVDIENQFNPFKQFLDMHREYSEKVTIIKYHSPKGHGGMWDKDKTIELLNAKVITAIGFDEFLKISQEASIPKEFNIMTHKNEYITSLDLNDNLYIPLNYIQTNYAAETEFLFNKEHGMASLTLISNYYYPKAVGNLQYEIYVNGSLLAQ